MAIGRTLLGLGILAMPGCAVSSPAASPSAAVEQPLPLLGDVERPREDYSERSIPQDDAEPAAAEELADLVRGSGQGDG
jgi:hypothetical protein